jgi:multidrug efflux pump subunit AcrA (membrane-fusion protein)
MPLSTFRKHAKHIALISLTVSLCGCSNSKVNQPAVSSSEPVQEKAPATPEIKVVKVELHRLTSDLSLPGNLEAFEDVPLHAKVEGYVTWIGVDRGSFVKKGQPLITIAAPEVDSKVKEAGAKVSSADADYEQSISAMEGMKSKQVEAEAKLDADRLTLTRLQEANRTKGAVAQNDVDMAEKAVEGDTARVSAIVSETKAAANLVLSQKHNVSAAQQLRDSLRTMRSYLTIKAPFDGVITERNVHPGSIVAVESSRAGVPMLRVQDKAELRLVVAVPESSVSGIKLGQKIAFTVPAFMGRTFYGIIARPGYALDTRTRTMPVELSVDNRSGELDPGMFATVKWNVSRPNDTMFLPQSAVASDLSGTFVVRVTGDVAERVPVAQGAVMNDLVEVSGDLKPGDQVALKATDEIKSGSHCIAKLARQQEIAAASKHTSAGGE